MKFEITKEQLEEAIKLLCEMQAKYSFMTIDMLRKLPAIPETSNANFEVKKDA